MNDFFTLALQGFAQQSAAEWIAVILALAYLILALQQNIWCWPCALISTALFSWVFFDVSLVMDSALNVYYMAMAIYGFWAWQKGSDEHGELKITTWTLKQHAVSLTIIALATVISGYLLHNNTQAAWPYLDSFTTWASVVTTYMVARKIFENWIYWLVINSCSLFLYIDRGLYPTALLMMLYLVLVVIGIVTWSRQLRNDTALSSEKPLPAQ